MREETRNLGLDYEEDVAPLLGNDVAISVRDLPSLLDAGPEEEEPEIVAAWETHDADALVRLVERLGGVRSGEIAGATTYRLEELGGGSAAVDGAKLVVALTEGALEEALRRSDGGDGLEAEQLARSLDDLPADAPIRIHGDATSAAGVPELRRFAGLPWVDALRSFGLALSAGEDELRLDAFLRTDGDGLDEDDLPLEAGEETPEVADRADVLAGGNRNQSRTTVFLLRAVRHAFPDSRFVRDVEELERELGLDFEDEILRQFDGPSVSVVDPDGEGFAARSEVSDPDALREAMRALAPRLPRLIEDLEALQPAGMALLFLLAPDAPVTMQALTGVQIEEPETEDDLYRVTGLGGDGPDELHFGVVGDVFVIGSSGERARAISEVETVEADGARGAGVVRFTGDELREGTAGPFGLGPASCAELGIEERPCEELVASAEASLDGIRVRVRLKVGEEE